MSRLTRWRLPVSSGIAEDLLVVGECLFAALCAYQIRRFTENELATVATLVLVATLLFVTNALWLGVRISCGEDHLKLRRRGLLGRAQRYPLDALAKVALVEGRYLSVVAEFSNGETIIVGPWSKFHWGLRVRLKDLTDELSAVVISAS
jgi:hypothetical protein